MDSKLNACCKLCGGSKTCRTDKKRTVQDMIEKTTNCRLALDGGTVLTVREVLSQVDEVATRNRLDCLCEEPSLDSLAEKTPGQKKSKKVTGGSSSNRNPPHLHLGTRTEQHNDFLPKKYKLRTQTREEAWDRYQRCKQQWSILLNAVVERDGECQRKFKKLMKPRWYHELSIKQMHQLETLSSALLEDAEERCSWRTKQILREIGVHPKPDSAQLLEAMKVSQSNPILVLAQILTMIKSEEPIENTDETYSWNQRLLMSAIAFLEMPYLLLVLLKRLPDPPVTEISSPITVNFRRKKNQGVNPYLQPVWVAEPWDWKFDRDVAVETMRQQGCHRRQAKCPNVATHATASLSHVVSQVTPHTPSFKSCATDSVESTEEAQEECAVLKMFPKLNAPSVVCPDTPPPSWHGAFAGRSDVAELLGEVQFSLQDHLDSKDVKFMDIESGFQSTLEDLQQRGMVSAHYPDIKLHPILLQLVQHLTGEEMTKPLKRALLNKSETSSRCIRELYRESQVPNPKKQPPDATWATVQHLRQTAHQQRQIFLQGFQQKRYQASQNLWRTFEPRYIQSRPFLPIFYSYMPSSLESVNLWPENLKELL